MQPDSLENRLLQLCSIRCSIRTIQMLQRAKYNATRTVLEAPRCSDVNTQLQTLHWLPVEQRINYKLADDISAVSESADVVVHERTLHSIVVRPTFVRAISTDIICQTIVQHCRPLTSNSLPPAMLNCYPLFLSLLSNPSLKLICFLLLFVNCLTA